MVENVTDFIHLSKYIHSSKYIQYILSSLESSVEIRSYTTHQLNPTSSCHTYPPHFHSISTTDEAEMVGLLRVSEDLNHHDNDYFHTVKGRLQIGGNTGQNAFSTEKLPVDDLRA